MVTNLRSRTRAGDFFTEDRDRRHGVRTLTGDQFPGGDLIVSQPPPDPANWPPELEGTLPQARLSRSASTRRSAMSN